MSNNNYPEVERPTYLWVLGVYDGPLDGICLYEGQKHYFEMFDETWEEYSSDSDPELDDLDPYLVRHYFIRKLDPVIAAREEARHNLFIKYVRDDRAYRDDQGRPIDHERKVKPEKLHRYFYDHPLRDEIGTYLALEFGLTFPILDTFLHILYSKEVKDYAQRSRLYGFRGEIVAWFKC